MVVAVVGLSFFSLLREVGNEGRAIVESRAICVSSEPSSGNQ